MTKEEKFIETGSDIITGIISFFIDYWPLIILFVGFAIWFLYQIGS